jgi:hypothetical protein
MMEDIGEKISNLLNSPDGMERIKALAEGLLSNNPTPNEAEKPEQKSQGLSIPDNILQNMDNIGGIMRIVNLLSKEQKDSRIELLRALKPHLSAERAGRVNKAISILKIATILPALKEEGLLNFLGGDFIE